MENVTIELGQGEVTTERLCICGKHVFSVEEIEMGSICPKCLRDNEGKELGDIRQRRNSNEEEKGKA